MGMTYVEELLADLMQKGVVVANPCSVCGVLIYGLTERAEARKSVIQVCDLCRGKPH